MYRIPTRVKPNVQDLEISIARAALASLVTCTLPFRDILKVKIRSVG